MQGGLRLRQSFQSPHTHTYAGGDLMSYFVLFSQVVLFTKIKNNGLPCENHVIEYAPLNNTTATQLPKHAKFLLQFSRFVAGFHLPKRSRQELFSDATGFKQSGSGSARVQTFGFGLGIGLCFGLGFSRVRVFCRVFILSFITNQHSGLVRVYVEKSSSGFGL